MQVFDAKCSTQYTFQSPTRAIKADKVGCSPSIHARLISKESCCTAGKVIKGGLLSEGYPAQMLPASRIGVPGCSRAGLADNKRCSLISAPCCNRDHIWRLDWASAAVGAGHPERRLADARVLCSHRLLHNCKHVTLMPSCCTGLRIV